MLMFVSVGPRRAAAAERCFIVHPCPDILSRPSVGGSLTSAEGLISNIEPGCTREDVAITAASVGAGRGVLVMQQYSRGPQQQ